MKLRNIAFVLMVCASAACGRANDLPAMQSEANHIAQSYSTRFDALAVRAESLRARGRALKGSYGGAEEASSELSALTRKIGSLRSDAAKAPADIKNAANISRDELNRTMDTMSQRLDTEWTETNAELDAVDAWLARSERSEAMTIAYLSAPQATSGVLPSEPVQPDHTVTEPVTPPTPTPSGTTQPATPGTPAAPAPVAVPTTP